MEYVKNATMIVAIDSLIAGFALACSLVIFSAPTAMVHMVGDGNITTQHDKEYYETVLRLTGAVLITFLAVNLLLIMMLHAGARHQSVTKLRTWLVANSFLTCLVIFETLLIGEWSGARKIMFKVPNFLFILYRILTIHIIWKFLSQIKADTRARDLTQIKICIKEEQPTQTEEEIEPEPEMIKNLD